MGTQTLDKPTDTDTNNPDEMAHYVIKKKMTDAAVFGQKVKALCGHEFIPKRDAHKLPPCQKCVEIFKQLPK